MKESSEERNKANREEGGEGVRRDVMYINEEMKGVMRRKRGREQKEMTSEQQQGLQLTPDETTRGPAWVSFVQRRGRGRLRERAQASDGASWLAGALAAVGGIKLAQWGRSSAATIEK